MSLKLMVRVMETIDVTRPQQAVLLAMAENASDDGSRCFPSVDLIAWKAGYKVRNVVDIMRDLRQSGVLQEVAPAVGTRPVEYQIHLDRAPQKLSFEEWQPVHGRHSKRNAPVHSHEKTTRENAPVQNDEGCILTSLGVQSHETGVHSHEKTTREIAPRTVSEPSEEPTPTVTRAQAGRTAGSTLNQLIDDLMPKIVPDFLAISPEFSATWLRRALAEAEVECDGGAMELAQRDVVKALELAHIVISRAMQSDNPRFRIEIPKAFATSKVVEAVCERLNDVREQRHRPPAPPTTPTPISSRPPPSGFSRTAAAIERERHEQHSSGPITQRLDDDRPGPEHGLADGRGDRDPRPRPDAGQSLAARRVAPVRCSPAEHRPRAPDRDPVHDPAHRGLPGPDGAAGRPGRPRA